MKYIIIILLALSLAGCSQPIVADTVSTTAETVIVTETVTQYVTVEDTAKITELQNEVDSYKALLGNLNELLSNVYYVYQKKSDGSSVWATGFSIDYNDKFYLITAGHVVDNEFGIFKNLGFKVNDKFIYPKLLDYNKDIDYAVFYSDKIKSGLKVGEITIKNEFVLGSVDNDLNVFRSVYDRISIAGESGALS
jgi:hypothetical protein